MSYSSTDVANKCQISPVTELSDSFRNGISYLLPSVIKTLYTRQDSDLKQHYLNNSSFQNSNLRWCMILVVYNKSIVVV